MVGVITTILLTLFAFVVVIWTPVAGCPACSGSGKAFPALRPGESAILLHPEHSVTRGADPTPPGEDLGVKIRPSDSVVLEKDGQSLIQTELKNFVSGPCLLCDGKTSVSLWTAWKYKRAIAAHEAARSRTTPVK